MIHFEDKSKCHCVLCRVHTSLLLSRQTWISSLALLVIVSARVPCLGLEYCNAVRPVPNTADQRSI